MLDQPANPGVAELRLRLSFELRVGELDGDDCCETFAHVLAVEIVFLLLQQALGARVVVQRARQRSLEAGEVRAAFVRVDVVGEREDRLLIAVVPLHRDFDLALIGRALEVDDVLVGDVLRFVDVGDEVLDPAFVVKLDRLTVDPFVDECHAQALGQERHLAQPRNECRRVEVGLVEDRRVGQERDRRPRLRRRADLLHRALRDATRELLAVDLAVQLDGRDQPVGECVHDRRTDAVQAAGDLVALAAELSAGMKLGQDHLERRDAGAWDLVDGDTAAAVDHRDRVVRVNRHRDGVVVARESFVDGVVDDLVDEVMKAPGAGRSDVHARAQTDGLETFEHRDVLGRVAGLRLSLCHNQEMPAKRGFCQALKVYQIGVSDRPRARLKETAFCTLSRRF